MSRPAPDPTRWFTDLINSQNALLTATADGAEIPATKQWTDALTTFTKWQMDSWNQLTGQWAAMFGMEPSFEPIKDRRFSGEAWTEDPRFEAVARAYLAQVDLLTKALDASPLDERNNWR
jgi:polyhydroxyalkanoate synthase